MAHKGLAIMIADKMPPPDKLGKSKDDYGDSGGDYSSDDGGDDDEQTELDTMRDLRGCIKSGDDKGALGHLKDLISMLSSSDEKDEG